MLIIKNQVAFAICDIKELTAAIKETKADYDAISIQAYNAARRLKEAIPTRIVLSSGRVLENPFWQEKYLLRLLDDCSFFFDMASNFRKRYLETSEKILPLLEEAQNIKHFFKRRTIADVSEHVSTVSNMLLHEYKLFQNLPENLNTQLKEHNLRLLENDWWPSHKKAFQRYLNFLQTLQNEMSPQIETLKKIQVFLVQMADNN